jgi:hypothetical protein
MGLGLEFMVGVHRSREQSAATDRIRPLRGAMLTCGCVIMLCPPQSCTVLLKRVRFSILTSGNSAFGPLGHSHRKRIRHMHRAKAPWEVITPFPRAVWPTASGRRIQSVRSTAFTSHLISRRALVLLIPSGSPVPSELRTFCSPQDRRTGSAALLS